LELLTHLFNFILLYPLVPVVSDPHLPLSKEDYFPISQRGFYREKSTGWRFYFKHIPGLDYPLKCYNDPVGTRELTQGEKDKVAPIWNEVIGKHTRPSILPQPKTWKIAALQQKLRQEHPTCSIDKFPFVDIFGNNKFDKLYDDYCPVLRPEKPDKKFFRNLLTYIEFRFLDWLEAGGKRFHFEPGQDFWIDIWDPEVLECAQDPEKDTHPRKLLLQQWAEDYEEWVATAEDLEPVCKKPKPWELECP
jgi:hypothetical protein